MLGREGEVRLDRQIGFDQIRLAVVQRLARVVASLDFRHRAEQRQAEPPLDLGRIGDRLVDLLEREGERGAQAEARAAPR